MTGMITAGYSEPWLLWMVHRIGRHQHVEFAKPVSDRATVKARNDFACIGVDVADIADVAVIDLLIVIVLDLHDLVAGGEGPAEPLHLAITCGIERCLQFDVQRPCTYAAAVHRTKHLDVTNGIEAEPPRDPCLH